MATTEKPAAPFTPGPWRVHQHDHMNGELWLSIGFHTHEGTDDPDGRWIGPVAELKYLIAREDEQWANARLIAAAPDLYAALSRLANEASGFLSMADEQTHGHTNIAVLRQRIDEARAVLAKAEGHES